MAGSLPSSMLCCVYIFVSEKMSPMASDVTFEGFCSGEGMISFTFDY